MLRSRVALRSVLSASSSSSPLAHSVCGKELPQILHAVPQRIAAGQGVASGPARPWCHVKGLATSSQTRSPTPGPRRRLLPLLAGVTVLLAGSTFYLKRDPPSVLAPDRWTAVKVQSVTPLTPETSLFRLEVPKSMLPEVIAGDHGAQPVLSVFVKDPNLQIQRAYTPLSSSSFNSSGPAILDLVVKRYADGEVSRYIHRLGAGDEMWVRGPAMTWYYRPQDWDEVVFIVGGTGVTPAYQLLNDTLRSSSSPSSSGSFPSPAVSLIYASPSPSRILLRPELDSFAAQDPSKVSIKYLVDGLDPGTGKSSLPRDSVLGMLDRKKLQEWIGKGGDKSKRRMVVVCGPEGMINVVAGPRGRNFSQGPIGGILKELGYTEREVLKL
ncbi:hypothetical protein JCM1841_003951 [Sporobolomyces salmonicolor]